MPEPEYELQQSRMLSLEDSDSDDEGPPAARSIEVGSDFAAMLGLPAADAPTTADTKTRRFHDRTIGDDVDTFATVKDRTVTATRMVNLESGIPFLLLSYAYTISSTGWRTGRGPTAQEESGAPHRIVFRNRDGGIMYSWGLTPQLVLDCGWQARPETRFYAERYAIGWFDFWATSTYYVDGWFYPCG